MSEIVAVGLDLAKNVPGAWSDGTGRAILRKKLRQVAARSGAGVFLAAAVLRRGDGSLRKRAFPGS